MLATLARDWWLFAVQGAAAIIFGILALVWPGLTLATLVLLFGAYALVDGVFAVISGLARERGRDWWLVLRGVAGIQWRRAVNNEWMLILGGILSIIFGLLLAFFPGAGALSLVWLIGAYAIVFGILFIILAFRLRGMRHEGETGAAPGV